MVSNLLAEVPDHSKRSTTKYQQLELYLARLLRVPTDSIYAAYVSKAGNTTVRFDQSPRPRQAKILVAVVDPPHPEHPMRAVEALERYCAEKRPDAEVLVFTMQKERGWYPYAAIFVSSEVAPALQPIIDASESIRVLPQAQMLGSISAKRSSASLRFVVMDRQKEVRGLPYPIVVLQQEDWPDGKDHYQTLFSAYFYSDSRNRELLGEVKILEKGQAGGRTQMPQGLFKRLNENYCSLGQSRTYYEALRSLPQSIYQKILRGLRDMVYDEDVREDFGRDPGFSKSLIRTGKAALALEEAGELFKDDVARPRRGRKFTFDTQVGGERFEIDFAFDQSPSLPDRINAVIGYNGTGKTQLLANIALVATSDSEQRREANRQYGKILNTGKVLFSSVIAISYSAFDTFALPDQFWESEEERRSAAKRLRDKGEVNGYAYCGLRKRAPGQKSRSPRGLKSIDEVSDEFARALDVTFASPEKRSILRDAMRTIRKEPSFARVVGDPEQAETREALLRQFSTSSTGHKIVLNMLVQIIAHSDPRSLILIDEPESHLHPSLLAALMRALNVILRSSLNSYAIVATHSPVVLQEIPRNYVRILQRFGQTTRVVRPKIETFGENVGHLTTNVFHLDSTETDFHATLRELAATKTIEEIEDLFDDEMSAQAQAYVLGFMRSLGRL
ncbi:AAA domain-containing protein, putative AbiEii toxin, Type IV TA system [Lentzea aerocolonigenes]|nr:AAA domain-containing protein, putative AbiEii toxin, Type IV TA system [Lentzea aerocolonigenes]